MSECDYQITLIKEREHTFDTHSNSRIHDQTTNSLKIKRHNKVDYDNKMAK